LHVMINLNLNLLNKKSNPTYQKAIKHTAIFFEKDSNFKQMYIQRCETDSLQT